MSYAYGWAVLDTEDGTAAWHNGGNDWSLANFARDLPDGAMTYWVTNQANTEDWHLEDDELELTKEILARA
jgi:hypothetical protein